MVNLFIFLILLLLPIGFANMAPVFASRMPVLRYWNTPLDLGYLWKGKQILGANKTWRGLVTGIFCGIVVQVLVIIFINYLSPNFYLPANYSSANPVVLGFLFGCGALVGDVVKSFFKRRMKIPSGKSWVPWDQIDYILGAIVFSYWYVQLPIGVYLLLLVFGFAMHLVTVYIGYLLKLRDQAI